MKRLVSICAVLITLAFISCGPRPDDKTPDDETTNGQTNFTTGEGGATTKHVSTACKTSDDCDEGLTCIDDGCVLLAPGGFY